MKIIKAKKESYILKREKCLKLNLITDKDHYYIEIEQKYENGYLSIIPIQIREITWK